MSASSSFPPFLPSTSFSSFYAAYAKWRSKASYIHSCSLWQRQFTLFFGRRFLMDDLTCPMKLTKGPSTRVRFCERIDVRFRAWFANKGFRVSIFLRTPIKTACQHISGKISYKLYCKPTCAGNRTQNRTCRRPISKRRQIAGE
jgi:hypothetical protein